MKGPSEESLIHHFAIACERMNDFARSLRRSSVFQEVRTGADIRQYESGWRLEKWVEAQLDPNEGLWAAWWLELGASDRGWVVKSHLAISPNILFIGLADRFAVSPSELERSLSTAVEELRDAMQNNLEFAQEVKRRTHVVHKGIVTQSQAQAEIEKVKLLLETFHEKNPGDKRFEILSKELNRVKGLLASRWPLPKEVAADFRFGLFAVKEFEGEPKLSDSLSALDHTLKASK